MGGARMGATVRRGIVALGTLALGAGFGAKAPMAQASPPTPLGAQTSERLEFACEPATLVGTGALDRESNPLPGPAPSQCSMAVAGDRVSILRVTNDSCATVDIWWVDADCKEVYVGTVEAGSVAALQTRLSHPFRLRLVRTRELVKEIPPGTVEFRYSG